MKYGFANWRCDGVEIKDAKELDISQKDLDIINSWLSIEECEIVPETLWDIQKGNYVGKKMR